MEMHLSLVLEVFDGEFSAALGFIDRFITSQRGLRCFIVGLPQNVLNLGCCDSTEDPDSTAHLVTCNFVVACV